MKPDLTKILNTGSMTLMGEIAPLLEGGYGSGTVSSVGLMMLFAAQEMERGLEMRMRSIDDMQSLFRRAVPILSDEALARSLTTAAELSPSNLLLSEVDAKRSQLRELIIELHAYVEEADSDDARALDRDIWDLLARDAARFEISLAEEE